MTYLKPKAIILLHFLRDSASWSYSSLALKVDMEPHELVNLAKALSERGLVETRFSTVQITNAGKWALSLGTVEE